MAFLKPEPAGDAMKSVRIMAAGAVFVVCLANLTAPARACDDRFIKKCEKASAAAFAADEAASEPSARRPAKRVRVVTSRRSRHAEMIRHRKAPRFAARRAERVELAESVEPRRVLPDTPMARRFRGFINPQPIAQNAFEALRKPHAVAVDFDAAMILPPVVAADAEPVPAEAVAQAAAPAPVVTTAKQDKLVAKPGVAKPAVAKPAVMELASAESKPVVLPDLPRVKPVVAQASVAEIAIAPAQTVVSAAPPADQKPGPFPIHGLVLALCGALGAASALRFIVGA
jgi:hypothetical protein